MLVAFRCHPDGMIIDLHKNGLRDETVPGTGSTWADYIQPDSFAAAHAFLETIQSGNYAQQVLPLVLPECSCDCQVFGYMAGDVVHILASVSPEDPFALMHTSPGSHEALPIAHQNAGSGLMPVSPDSEPGKSGETPADGTIDIQDLLAALPDVLPDVIHITDLQTGNVLFQNRGLDFLKSPGTAGVRESNELLEADIHPHDRPELEEYLQNFHNLSPGETREIEFRIRKEEQHWHWYLRRDTCFACGPGSSSRYILSLYLDINHRRLTQLQLMQMSIRDPLTDLYNRVYFDQELVRLQQSRQFPISILMADVDGLKPINDALGHSTGDKLLRRAAEVLRKAFRNEDVVARLGGDEFGVILTRTSEQDLAVVLKRIHSILHEYNEDLTQIEILMSIGSATAQKGEQLSQTLREADLRMYRNKSERKANGLQSPSSA